MMIMSGQLCQILIDQLLKLRKRFPHVATRIECRWGSEAGHQYLKSLLCVNREMRVGFPEEDFWSIMRLYMIHSHVYSDFGNPLTMAHMNIALPGLQLIKDPTYTDTMVSETALG